MSEDIRKIMVGGMVGGEGTVAMIGNDLTLPEEEVKQALNLTDFMLEVGCFGCIVVSELEKKPSLDVQAVFGSKDRTLITVVCPGAVEMIKKNRQTELQCHTPKTIELVFNRE